MKESNKKSEGSIIKNQNEISCGNCWGHQEYSKNYVDKTIDLLRGKKDNFISRFVKKYIQST